MVGDGGSDSGAASVPPRVTFESELSPGTHPASQKICKASMQLRFEDCTQ